MIRAKNISKKIGETSILNDIDINVNSGEITVIIGPSGSGKTTLLNCISMLHSPNKGSVELDGVLLEFPNKKDKIRSQFKYDGNQQIGVVFQNINLIPHWTNFENIINPLLRVGKYDKNELTKLVKLFKIENIISKTPSNCSRGEQQRVAIVRAVMLKPKYLFLDEVTSALDPELIAILFKYLIKLKEKGVGILLVTHFLVFAQNVADRIVFIHKGKIIEEGTNEIMMKPKTKIFQEFLLSLEDIIINKKSIKI